MMADERQNMNEKLDTWYETPECGDPDCTVCLEEKRRDDLANETR